MKPTIVNAKPEAGCEGEATLRLIAGLAAPEGLAERVKAGLATAETATPRGRVLAWPSMARSGWLKGAAAAALLLAVAGGGWSAYVWVAPAPVLQSLPPSASLAPQGGFSAAGAVRRPETVVGPMAPIPVVPEKKVTNGAASKRGKALEKAVKKVKAEHE